MGSRPVPSDMVAVYDGFKFQWWVYFVSTEGEIRFLTGPKDGQLEDTINNPPYEESSPQLDAARRFPVRKPVILGLDNPRLGVCEYLDNSGSPQVTLL